MRKGKALRALLPVVMAVSILAGCGESQETMGSAEGTRQEEIRGAEDAASSEESKETEEAVQPEESGASGETVQEEEPKEAKPLVLAKTVYKVAQVIYGYDGIQDVKAYRVQREEYDTSGNLVRDMYYEPLGVFENDASGNATIVGYEDADYAYLIYEYDMSGNVTKEIHYISDGSIDYSREYEYDAFGNMAKKIDYKNDGSIGS